MKVVIKPLYELIGSLIVDPIIFEVKKKNTTTKQVEQNTKHKHVKHVILSATFWKAFIHNFSNKGKIIYFA